MMKPKSNVWMYGVVLACVIVVIATSVALVIADEHSDTDSESISTPTGVSSSKAINASYLIQYSRKYGMTREHLKFQ